MKTIAKKRILLAFMIIANLTILFSFNGNSVFAMQEPLSVKIPVQQIFHENGSKGADSTFNYTLKALESANPMPEGSDGNIYNFSINGNGNYDINITYPKVGIYKYVISPAIKGEKEGYTYDKREYTAEIYVKNASDTNFYAQVILKDPHNDKPAKAMFEHSYTKKAEINTGDKSRVDAYVFLVLISMLYMVFIVIRNRREKSQSN